MKKTFVAFRSIFALALLVFGFFATANAQSTTTFAQFIQQSSNRDFTFNNNGSSASFTTINGGSPISFKYQGINNLPAELKNFQDAHMFVTSGTSMGATINGTTLLQPVSDSVSQVQIIRDTPASVGFNSRTNLLTITFSPGNGYPYISGSNTGSSGNFSVSTPDQTVTFTSDFLSFTTTNARNFAFSFSGIFPTLSQNANNLLNSFEASGSGTFASNPVPVYLAPTAASVTVAGRVFSANKRPLSSARVLLTQPDGSQLMTTTNAFGYYRFDDVQVGGTVVVNVISKRYTYQSQILSVSESFSNVNFTPQQ